MTKLNLLATLRSVAFANDNDALIPEMWAQEALLQLENNLVAVNLIHRDFSREIASFGDVVNAHRPSTFTMMRGQDNVAVVTQDATVTNVPVSLNMMPDVSFIISDGERSKAFKDLVALHLVPAMRAMAQGIDSMVTYQVYQFMGSHKLGKLGTAWTKSTVIDAKAAMSNAQVPEEGRFMLINPNIEANLLAIDNWVTANTVGDNGTALARGYLGQKFGFDFYTTQNMPSITAASQVTDTGAINSSSGYAAGSTSLVVDGFTGLASAEVAGSWCTIAGDMQPQRITAASGGANTTGLTISPGLKYAVADDAVVTIYAHRAVNYGSGYSAGYNRFIAMDDGGLTFAQTGAPESGQLISFGASATPLYGRLPNALTATYPNLTNLMLERPIDSALTNNDAVGYGPAGEYCMALHRDAIAFVNRPLAVPMSGTGARSFVADFNGLSVRVTITYDGSLRGHRVVIDMLCGIKVLNADLGLTIFG